MCTYIQTIIKLNVRDSGPFHGMVSLSFCFEIPQYAFQTYISSAVKSSIRCINSKNIFVAVFVQIYFGRPDLMTVMKISY